MQDSTVSIAFNEKVTANSAGNIANYSIPGLILKSIKVWDNLRGVDLDVSQPDTTASYTLVAFSITDQFDTPNTMLYDSTPIIKSKPVSFPVKINAGADFAYKDYLPDQVWGPETEYGHMDGYHNAYPASDVENSEEDSLFKAQLEEVVRYYIRVPDGVYNVEMQFAETYFDEDGKRIFSVLIEDSLLIENFDIHAVAGFNKATSLKMNNVTVNDGLLEIAFDNWTEDPTVNAITVERVTTAIDDQVAANPLEMELKQNFPNPFNPSTQIDFNLAGSAEIELNVYNISGQQIKTLFSGMKNKGQHSLTFNGSDLASGVYYYSLTVKSEGKVFTDHKKMLLIK